MASLLFSVLFVVVMAGLTDWAMGRFFWADRRSIYHDLRERERFQRSIEKLGRAVQRSQGNLREIKKSSV